MESGSLLQEAISRQAETQDGLQALYLDVFLLVPPDHHQHDGNNNKPTTTTATSHETPSSSSSDYDYSLPQHLLALSELAKDLNDYFQQQRRRQRQRHYQWHLGGDGPVFGIAASSSSSSSSDDDGGGIPHLRAICRYGANVADEWAAIQFCLEFSQRQQQVVGVGGGANNNNNNDDGGSSSSSSSNKKWNNIG